MLRLQTSTRVPRTTFAVSSPRVIPWLPPIPTLPTMAFQVGTVAVVENGLGLRKWTLCRWLRPCGRYTAVALGSTTL